MSQIGPFIEFLADHPDVDGIPAALAHGPLESFGILSLSLWIKADRHRVLLLDSIGHSAMQRERYEALDADTDWPMTRSMREMEIRIDSANTLMSEYLTVNVDAHLWSTYLKDSNSVDLVSVPIIHRGVVIAGIAFSTTIKVDWGPKELNLLRWCAAAMTLWFTQENNRIYGLARPFDNVSAALTLSPRQVEIVSLVEAEKSNSYIANVLGFSESTVKQELQRSMKILNVSNRLDLVERARAFDLLPPPRSFNPEADSVTGAALPSHSGSS
jgi:DNA-binding CsgD family transcriptional regulator